MKNLFFILIILLSFSCQKVEVEKEQPSGIITLEVEGVKYNFSITRYVSKELNRGAGIFEAINSAQQESVTLGLIDDWRSNKGIQQDFFAPTFIPDPTLGIGIKILGEGFQPSKETVKISIEKADFATKTLEGSFSFSALGEISKKNIKVENGYFKIELPDWLYQ